MTERTFRLDDMAGLCGRVLRIRSTDCKGRDSERSGPAALSGQTKRRRILEEARSAVLDRIRSAR